MSIPKFGLQFCKIFHKLSVSVNFCVDHPLYNLAAVQQQGHSKANNIDNPSRPNISACRL